MRDIDKLLAGANSAMREKLEENSHKSDWKDLKLTEIMKYSDVETAEIKLALYFVAASFHPKAKLKNLKDLRREVADRMNFDAMAIARCDKMIEELENAVEQKD